MRIIREPIFRDPPQNFFIKLGRGIFDVFQHVGRACLITGMAVLLSPKTFTKRNFREVAHNMFITGIKSLSVITVVALFTGMIFALQIGLELRRYGQEVNIGGAVAVTMLREMGPFMTALIIAASVGSAIAAQIGTMVVSEEVAALEIMSIDPIRFLVMPRLVALAFMMPILTFYTNILAMIGGSVVGYTQLGVPWRAFYDNALEFSANKDLWVGLLKAHIFGIIISTVACYQGFVTSGGAVGVGRATRQTVVISFLMILMVGYMITRLFYE